MAAFAKVVRNCNQWIKFKPHRALFSTSSSPRRVERPDEAACPSRVKSSDPVDALQSVQIPGVDESEVFRGMNSEFPCLDFARSPSEGPEPAYNVNKGYRLYEHHERFPMKYNRGVLPGFSLAYETWGELNASRDNAVMIWSGMSGNSHCKSNEADPSSGWWEDFVGPDSAIDTNKFFVICTNHLGSCFGSTGPSSTNPLSGEEYATTFPIVSVDDIVVSTFALLDHLNVDRLHSSMGSSLGGMCSLVSGALYPERVGKIISISACTATHPASMAMRYVQRRMIMFDPNWCRGLYYKENKTPRLGVKMAREMAFITYRSGPEWDGRFGRQRVDENADVSFCPEFLIESYLDYQGTTSCTKFDANTLLYLSKAMDLYDMTDCGDVKYDKGLTRQEKMIKSLSRVVAPVMVIGVQTDSLIPVTQQRQMAKLLNDAGNNSVTYFELNSLFGHDTFLLDVNSVGSAVKGFLETNINKQNERNIFIG